MIKNNTLKNDYKFNIITDSGVEKIEVLESFIENNIMFFLHKTPFRNKIYKKKCFTISEFTTGRAIAKCWNGDIDNLYLITISRANHQNINNIIKRYKKINYQKDFVLIPRRK